MPALCEQFTHQSADTIGVFPAVTCTTHWIPEGLYSRAAKPLSQHLQTANHLTLQHCHLYIGLSCNSLLFYSLFSYFIISISCTWSWIIDVHGPVYVPPRELAGHISGKASLRHFRWPEMWTDENHRQAHNAYSSKNLCRFCHFFWFWPSNLFYFTLLWKGITCCVLWKRFFLKKGEQSCLTKVLQKSCQSSHMLHGVHGVDTMFMFCLVGFLWLISEFNFYHPSSISCVLGTSWFYFILFFFTRFSILDPRPWISRKPISNIILPNSPKASDSVILSSSSSPKSTMGVKTYLETEEFKHSQTMPN